MNGIIPPEENQVRELILLLGSNINPEANIEAALNILNKEFFITRKSSAWESLPVGSPGAHYLNQAIGILTNLPLEEIRFQKLRQIEAKLGRIRGANKNAPRTIDIDVILDKCQIIDEKVWQFAFVCIPVSQLEPDLANPETGQILSDRATVMKTTEWIIEKVL